MTITGVVAVVLLWLSLSGTMMGQATSAPSGIERRLTATLHQMYEAEKRKDLRFVLNNLTEDFAEVAGDGNIYHRSDILAGWSEVVLTDYKVSDCVFNLLTADVAYLSCRLEVDATYKGQPLPKLFRVTTVWVHQKDRWLIRFEQGTIIPEAPKKAAP